MNPEVLNLSVRRYLKKFGVTAQREIEQAVAEAVRQKRIQADAKLSVAVRLTIPEIGFELTLDGTLELE